jgi:tetratricopeptide (TPR) repeat protein
MKQFEEALASFRQAVAILEKLTAGDPGNVESQRFLSVIFNRMGALLVALERLDQAIESYRKDLDVARKLAVIDPSNAGWQHDLWASYYRLGQIEVDAKRLEAARASYAQAVSVIEKLSGANPENVLWQTELVATLVAFAPLGGDTLSAYKQALAILQRLEAAGMLPTRQKDWIALLQQEIEVLQK